MRSLPGKLGREWYLRKWDVTVCVRKMPLMPNGRVAWVAQYYFHKDGDGFASKVMGMDRREVFSRLRFAIMSETIPGFEESHRRITGKRGRNHLMDFDVFVELFKDPNSTFDSAVATAMKSLLRGNPDAK